MLVRIMAVVLAGLLISGCSLRLPGIGIDIGGNGGSGGPPHCPPGQAKKGNCLDSIESPAAPATRGKPAFAGFPVLAFRIAGCRSYAFRQGAAQLQAKPAAPVNRPQRRLSREQTLKSKNP